MKCPNCKWDFVIWNFMESGKNHCVLCKHEWSKLDEQIYASSPYDENGFKPFVIETDEAAQRLIDLMEKASK